MNKSEEDKIKHFQTITNCPDREYTIQFLIMYDWNLNFAVPAFIELNDQTNYIHSTNIQHLINQSNQHHSQQQTLFNSSIQLSDDENNSFNQEQIMNQSHRTSFLEHVKQIVVSNPKTSPSIFLNTNHLNSEQLIKYINENIMGRNLQIRTPWGIRTVRYADYTASGRGLKFIEQYILENVLPFYGNTHSENNVCASQTTRFREGSRSIIKKYLNANEEDALIFVGSGSTGAINKLVNVLQLKDPTIRDRTVVFISTFEHHSNILPWKETEVEFIRIPNTTEGLLNELILEEQLNYYCNIMNKQIICTFNAASNVTGILTDVDRISTLIHRYNGWAFWDYAAGGPYLKIDMNPSVAACKDAIFISPHKFVGGPETTGILIAKKKLFRNKVPSGVGGGTVNHVTRTNVEYHKDIETREEGGTPNIIGDIRTGLVFHLKESVGCSFIEHREEQLVKQFFDRFVNHEKLFILGSTKVKRLSIFSFVIYVPLFNKYLHHHFVCVLLNDLFGIQVRSGCSCAGPYVLDLLNIPDRVADFYNKFITEDERNKDENIPHNALMKLGFTRLNLSYFFSQEEVDFLLNALEFIAEEGWKFLSLYSFNSNNATWKLKDFLLENPPSSSSSAFHSLQMITFTNGLMEQKSIIEHIPSNNYSDLVTISSDNPIEIAKSIVNNIPKYVYDNLYYQLEPPLNIPEEYLNYIWFIIPRQIILQISNDYENNRSKNPPPFHPKSIDR